MVRSQAPSAPFEDARDWPYILCDALAITYANGPASIPWLYPLHGEQARGYAYESGAHFVHLYGSGSGQWVISSGLTAREGKEGKLEDWAAKTFGATSIAPMKLPPGTVVDAVWRPGLYYEHQVFQALDTNRVERRNAEQSLHALVERLVDLLLYVEPEGPGLQAYGTQDARVAHSRLHRSRERMDPVHAASECPSSRPGLHNE